MCLIVIITFFFVPQAILRGMAVGKGMRTSFAFIANLNL
jgi:hypothetical protein